MMETVTKYHQFHSSCSTVIEIPTTLGQTDRERDRWTNGQRQTVKRKTYGQTDRVTDRQTETDRQTDKDETQCFLQCTQREELKHRHNLFLAEGFNLLVVFGQFLLKRRDLLPEFVFRSLAPVLEPVLVYLEHRL